MIKKTINMKYASIDIGTNTLLMLVGENDNGNFIEIDDFHRIARLGEDVDKNHFINDNAIQRASEILNEYKKYLSENKVEKVRIVGTSALRDATNKIEVCTKLEEIIGYSLEIITGDEEAKLSFLGSQIDENECSVMDIGGGSTEIINGEGSEINSKISLNMGAVRLTERFNLNYPASHENINSAKDFIKSCLKASGIENISDNFISVAGTPTSLAAMAQGLKEYSKAKVHKYKLTIEEINNCIDTIKNNSNEELIKKFGIHPNRVDIILGGSLIEQSVMEYYDLEYTIVSTQGLRYGVMFDMMKKSI